MKRPVTLHPKRPTRRRSSDAGGGGGGGGEGADSVDGAGPLRRIMEGVSHFATVVGFAADARSLLYP